MKIEEVQSLAGKIVRLLPKDAESAVAVLALTFAVVTVSTGLDDDLAVHAFRTALKQMHDKAAG